jgi:hypothetical protein
MEDYSKISSKYAQINRPNGRVKDERYYMQMCQYVFGQLTGGAGTFIFARHTTGASRRSHWELRSYARGLQDTEKYLKKIGYSEQEVQKFREKNISHQPYAIYPKFRNIMISKFSDLDLQPRPEALDNMSKYEKLVSKNKMKFIKDPRVRAMVPEGMMPSEDSFIESANDVDYMYHIGGIQLPIEIAMKDALDMVMKNPQYELVDKMLVEDFVDLGGMACDWYIENGMQKVRYVDFARVIARPSIYPDFRDSDVRGYTSMRKVSDIMMEDETAVKSNWKDLKEAYHGYHTQFDDYAYRHRSDGYREDFSNTSDPMSGTGDFGVQVLKLYWLDIEEQRFVVGRHNRGNRIFEKVDADFELSDRGIRAGKRIETYGIQNMYSCNWIVGTDIVFNYGIENNIVRRGQKGSKSIVWPMMIYAAQEPSITEKVIPIIDDIQLAMMKRREIMAKIPPGLRMIVYKNRIRDSITLGGEKYDIKKILKMYQREGMMILEENDDYSMPGEDLSKGKPPVEFMQSGGAEELRIIEESIIVGHDRLRQVTGINPLEDGTATKADILKSVVESMRQSANNVLRPWMEGYITFKKNVYNMISGRMMLIAALDFDSLEYSPLYTAFSRFAHLGPDLLKYDIGINVKVVESSYIQFLMQDLLNKKDVIPPEAYMAVYDALEDKDVDKAQWLLIKFTNKAKLEEQARQAELMRIQSQAQGDAAERIEQTKLEASRLKLQAEQAKLREQAMLDEQASQNNHGRDIEKILIKSKADEEANKNVVRENRQQSVFPNSSQ